METTRLVVADSKDRDTSLYPNGNTFVLHLTTPIKNVSRVDLVSARVPNTMYNLTTSSNVMSVGTSNVSLPPGFYYAGGIAAAITNTGLVTVCYLVDEGHFIFSNPTPPFNLQIRSSELAKIVGLDQNFVYTGTLATSIDPTFAGSYIIRSNKIVNLSINEFIYLDIDELRTPNHVSTGKIVGSTGTVSGANAGRSFAPIVMDVTSACMKNFHESKDYKISVEYPEPIGVLSRLTIRWFDKNGSLMDFRGLDTNSFILRIYVIEEERSLPPPPPLHDVELKRIIEAMTMLPEKPPPPKKQKIPWVLIMLALILGVIVYFNVLPRTSAPPAVS